MPAVERPARSASGAGAGAWLASVERWLWDRRAFAMVPDLVLPEEPSEGPKAPPQGAPRVAFVGFPSHYSVALLLALLRTGVEVVGLATSLGANPAIAGRNALSQIADHLGIPLLRLARVNDYDSVVALRRLHAELMVVASFDQILHERALAIPRLGWMNVHPSLLPLYRGPEPVYWAIVAGETESGISFQRLARGIDAGPLLLQRRTEIQTDDDSGTLTKRLVRLGACAMAEAVALALAGATGAALNLERGSYYTSVGHRRVDGAGSAELADRLVRAGNPNMLAATQCAGRLCYVLKARRVDAQDLALGPRLHFPDGDLILEETVDRCGCHHGEPVGSCPHDE